MRAYTSNEVCERAGVTYRQLDNWTRGGAIGPSVFKANGTGTNRRWSAEDIVAVRLVRRLRSTITMVPGVSGLLMSVAARAVQAMRDAEDHRWLYVAGQTVGTCDEDELVEVVSSLDAAIVVDLESIREDHAMT